MAAVSKSIKPLSDVIVPLVKPFGANINVYAPWRVKDYSDGSVNCAGCYLFIAIALIITAGSLALAQVGGSSGIIGICAGAAVLLIALVLVYGKEKLEANAKKAACDAQWKANDYTMEEIFRMIKHRPKATIIYLENFQSVDSLIDLMKYMRSLDINELLGEVIEQVAHCIKTTTRKDIYGEYFDYMPHSQPTKWDTFKEQALQNDSSLKSLIELMDRQKEPEIS